MPRRPASALSAPKQEELEFLRDFDLLAAVAGQEEQLYQPASMQTGQQMMEPTFVRGKSREELGLGCELEEFMCFGPGIYLLFKLMKCLAIVFGVVSLLATATIVILAVGEAGNEYNNRNEIKANLLKTTIYNLTQGDFPAYVGLHFVIAAVLSASLIYWSEMERTYIWECLKVTTLASYATVVLEQLPPNYNQHQVQAYLSESFGPVAEIYTVRDFGDDLLDYKDIDWVVQAYKKQRALVNLQPDSHSLNSHKLVNQFFQFRSRHRRIKQQIKKSENYKPCFAFVQFKQVEDRDKLLDQYNKNSALCGFSQPQTNPVPSGVEANNQGLSPAAKYDLQSFRVLECQMEPQGIIWENIHLSRSKVLLKAGAMLCLMMVVLSLSIVLIILLTVIQMSVSNSRFVEYTAEQIRQTEDQFALLSYCVNLSLGQFYQQSDICSQYHSEYVKLTVLLLMIPLSISLFKFVLTELLKKLLGFRRYAYQISKIESQSLIIFLFYIMVTGVLQLFIYLGTSSTSFFNVFTPVIRGIINSGFDTSKVTLFADYYPRWYIVAAPNILIIGAVSFNISALGITLYCKLRQLWHRYRASGQKIQVQMNRWLRGYPLEIEDIYAAVLTIVCFTLLFGGALPLLYILGFASLAVLYWSYKFVFIRFCVRPLKYNHSVNRKCINMLLVALIVHCFVTPMFYRAPGIAQTSQTIAQSVIVRFLTLWYYVLLAVVLCLYLFLQKPIKKIFDALIQCLRNFRLPKQQSHNQNGGTAAESVNRRNFMLPTVVRHIQNQLQNQSYSMHQSTKYKDTLKVLYTINNRQRSRKTYLLNKQLFHLYEDSVKMSEKDQTEYRELVELIKLVRRDYKRFHLAHPRRKNPYQSVKQRLYRIYELSRQGQGRKYTLFTMGGNPMADSQGFSETGGEAWSNPERAERRAPECEKSSENGTGTKDIFIGSNLEQVIEEESCFQNETPNRRASGNQHRSSRQQADTGRMEQPGKKRFVVAHHMPQETQERFNSQKL